MRVSITRPYVILLAAVLLGGSGCSLIGFGIGFAIDSSNTDSRLQRSAEAFGDLAPGESLVLLLHDGKEWEGTFIEWECPATGEATAMDTNVQSIASRMIDDGISAVEADSQAVLRPGDILILRLINGTTEYCQYRGADGTHLYFLRNGDAAISTLPYGRIFAIRRPNGQKIQAPYDRQFLTPDSHSPITMNILLSDGMNRVPLVDIDWIRREGSVTHYKLILAAAGLLADVLVISSMDIELFPESSLGGWDTP